MLLCSYSLLKYIHSPAHLFLYPHNLAYSQHALTFNLTSSNTNPEVKNIICPDYCVPNDPFSCSYYNLTNTPALCSKVSEFNRSFNFRSSLIETSEVTKTSTNKTCNKTGLTLCICAQSCFHHSKMNKCQTKLLFCIFIDNKTTDGDLVNSRQHGAILFECLVTPCVSRMVLQFSIYRTISAWGRGKISFRVLENIHSLNKFTALKAIRFEKPIRTKI